MKEYSKATLNWLVINGRIGRHEFWRFYVAPQFAVAVLGALFESPELFLLALYIGLVGVVRRVKDTHLKRSKLVAFAIFLGVISIVALVFAFIFFMGSITGAGEKGLLELAQNILFFPALPIFLIPFILGSIPGMDMENKYGPVPKKKSFDKRILFVVSSFVLVLVVYNALLTLAITGEAPLIDAILQGDEPKIVRLVNDGEDPDQADLSGSTGLLLAVENGELSIAEHLLNAGANPNLPEGNSAFVRAIDKYSDNKWLIELMLEKGADLNQLNGRSNNLGPGKDFTRYDNEIMIFLINSGFDLNTAANKGMLIDVLTASHDRHVSKCHTLLKAGLDIDQLQEALNIVQMRLNDYPSAVEFLTIEQLIKERINKQLNEEIYPFDQFFKGPFVKITGNPDFEERQFKRPVKVRAYGGNRGNYIYKGPGTLYESVGVLKFGDFLHATAITNVGDEFVWFKISYKEMKENIAIVGYVSGDYLCSAGNWFKGLQHTYQFNDDYIEYERNKWAKKSPTRK